MAAAYFQGRICVEWLADGRLMRLHEPFVFVDSRGRRWSVHAGTHINGSSIPRMIWPLTGSPFVGRHRMASVPHDLFCRIRTRSAEDTHAMYREACLVAGCSSGEARRKAWAVRTFGPWWPEPDQTDPPPAAITSAAMNVAS